MPYNSILNILDNSRWIQLHQNIVKVIGAEAAIILSDMIETYNYSLKNNELKDNRYFFYTHKKCEERWGFKENLFYNRLLLLKKKGLISVKKLGLPCKNYFLINTEEIAKLFEENNENNNTNNNNSNSYENKSEENLEKQKSIENSTDSSDDSLEPDFDESLEPDFDESLELSDEYPDVGTEEEKESKPYCKHQIDTFINFHMKQEDKKYAEVLRNWCYYKIEKGQIFNSYPNIAKELKDIIELSGGSLFEAEYLVWWNMNKNYLKLYKASKDEVSLNSYRNRNSKKEEIFKQVNSKVNSKVLSAEEEIERKTDTYDINKKPYKNIEDPVLKEFDDKLWMNFGKFTYLNWFDNTRLKIKNDTIEIHCGNRFVCDEIEKKYMRDANYGSKGVRQGIETIAKNLNERPITKVNVVFDFDLRFMWEDEKN